MNSFKIRHGDLEARSCNDMLLLEGAHTKAEILKWDSEATCFAIAVFYPTKDGFELRFVSDRPFVYSTAHEFFSLAKVTMDLCKTVLTSEDK